MPTLAPFRDVCLDFDLTYLSIMCLVGGDEGVPLGVLTMGWEL